MTLNETICRMQEVVSAAKEKLEGNGFTMSVETDYMDKMLRTVSGTKGARYVTVSLVVGAEGLEEGDEYCMSLGADISRKGINAEQLEKDIETYGLFTYEELNAICPLSEEMFNAAGGAYLKISIGKGNLTIDELINMINRYSKFI